MALVETASKDTSIENQFRMACADELAAQGLYKDLKRRCEFSDIPDHIKDDILRRLQEIIKDEEQHFGSLLYCLTLLDPDFATNSEAGVHGK